MKWKQAVWKAIKGAVFAGGGAILVQLKLGVPVTATPVLIGAGVGAAGHALLNAAEQWLGFSTVHADDVPDLSK